MTEARPQFLGRAAAFIVGIVVLIGIAKTTFGVVLCAPLGLWAAHRLHRSRGRVLDAFSGWVSAVGAVIVALVILGGVMMSLVPARTWGQIRQAADSASAQSAKQPPAPPAWLDRIAPGAAARYSAQRRNDTPAFSPAFLVFGAGVLVIFLGNVIGTFGWAASMLLVFSVTGRWLKEIPPQIVLE